MRDDFGNIWIHRAKWAYLLGLVFALLLPVFYVIYVSFNEYGFAAQALYIVGHATTENTIYADNDLIAWL